MMSALLFHELTADGINSFIARKPHALMLIGAAGAGKESIAEDIAGRLLATGRQRLISYPFFTKITPEKQNITINQIRELHKFLQLKTTGNAPIRRVAVIINAHLMTVEAQNALLKVLEEPPADTVLLLTAVGEKSLLSTIYSRVQILHIKNPPQESAVQYFAEQGFEQTDIARAYLLSGGNIGLMSALMHNAADHELVHAIQTAKQLLAADLFTRLTKVDELAKEKESLPVLLFALKRIAAAALHNAAHANNADLAKRWHKSMRAVMQAESSMEHSPNIKLLLTNLILRM